MCESAGKSRVHESAIAIVAIPPATTAVTLPTMAATTPDSNAPSSFDALIEDHLDGSDAAAQLVRRHERDGGGADVDADHVDEPGHGECYEGDREPRRETAHDLRHAEEHDDDDERRPGGRPKRSPGEDHGRAERPDGGRGTQDRRAH